MKHDKLRNKFLDYMKENKLSQREVAKIVGVDPCTVSRFVTGKCNTTKKNIHKITSVLQANQKEIVLDETKFSDINKNQIFIVDDLRLEINRKFLIVRRKGQPDIHVSL